MSTGGDIEEKRLGRLLVRRAPLDDASPARSDGGLSGGFLEVRRLPREQGTRAVPSPAIIGIVAVLAIMLVTFAALVRSGPTIGAATTMLIVLASLVLVGRTRGSSHAVLSIEHGELCAVMDGRRARIRVEDVVRIGVGRDDPHRTLWAAARGRDERVLLFDGLSVEEAQLAQRAVEEALGLRRP